MKLSKELSEENRQAAILEIKAVMRENIDLRMHERYQVILLALYGKDYAEITEITGRSVPTCVNYVRAYRHGGLDGMQMGHSPGRPTRLTPEQEQIVADTITSKTPKDVGFPAEMNWSSPLVRAFIENEFDVKYSDRGTRNLLERLGFSFTKPTYTLAKADPEKQEEFRQNFEDTKKN